MERPRLVLREELAIEKLITFYYREMTKYFYAPGEQHSFWEFVYVDKGEVEFHIDRQPRHLQQGDMIFYKPDVIHGGRSINGSAPNLIIISFECTSPCMAYFEDRICRLQPDDRQLLMRIVEEGLTAFDPPIHSPRNTYPRRRPASDVPFGGEQLIRNYMEILLIQLIRKGTQAKMQEPLSTIAREHNEHEVVSAIIRYMKAHLSCNIPFDQLCSLFTVSRTRLKIMFKQQTGLGVMEYFNRLKVEQAKRLIREQTCSIAEIAEQLGYSSNHYFSRQFKRITGFAPSEYMRLISARTIKPDFERRW